MPKLEELYRAKGLTDADLELLKPLLTDPRFRAPLEETLETLQTENQIFKAENDRWSNWHETDGKPTLELYERDKLAAIERAASLEARLKEAEKAGFAPRRQDPDPNPQPNPQPAAFDPKAHKLVTTDDVTKYLTMEAQAIARSGNLIEEYRYLTGGQSLIDYTHTFPDGRTLKGLEALLEEARPLNVSVQDLAAKKFDFEGKRNTIAAAQKKAAEDAIRADERAKFIQQYGQPGQTPLMPSKDPFIPAPREGQGGQPWERGTAAEQRASRVNRAMQTQLKAQVM
jgi:hypothetical protein